MSLKSLEAKNVVLDKINGEIISTRIHLHSRELNLDNVGITRLTITLFHELAYVHFWQNLTYLNCSSNQLTSLDVQGLATLQMLECNHNQLTTLEVQGLAALLMLECYNNQLTTLNVQGLAALQILDCKNNQLTALNLQRLPALQILCCEHNQLTTLKVQGLAVLYKLCCEQNPLKELNLTGVHAHIRNEYAELEKSLLFNQLSRSDSFEARQRIIARLGADFTYKNCLFYSPLYAEKLFALDSANSAYHLVSSELTRACTFLPSFSLEADNLPPENFELNRKTDEEKTDINLSENADFNPGLTTMKKG